MNIHFYVYTIYCIYYCMFVLHFFKFLNLTKMEKFIKKYLYYAEVS